MGETRKHFSGQNKWRRDIISENQMGAIFKDWVLEGEAAETS